MFALSPDAAQPCPDLGFGKQHLVARQEGERLLHLRDSDGHLGAVWREKGNADQRSELENEAY